MSSWKRISCVLTAASYRAATVIVLATLGAAALQAQTKDTSGRVFSDFDIRSAVIAGEVLQTDQSRVLLERRRKGIEAYIAGRQATQPGLRIVPSRHGIPKLLLRDGWALSSPSSDDPVQIARDFLSANDSIFSFSRSEVADLRLVVRDSAPDATYLVFNQTVSGIDVFEGQIKFTLSKAGEVIQVAAGDAAPGLNTSSVPAIQPQDAERAVRSAVRADGTAKVLRPPELVIFPVDASGARLAWRLFLEVDANNSYEMLIDASDSELLFRRNTHLKAAQGRVWTQSPSQGTRQLVTFPSGWLAGTTSVTKGNNVDAYIDADGNDTPDALNTGEFQDGRAFSSTQLFDFAFGDGTVGLNPRDSKAAAVTNLFYFVNSAHDFYYGLGFTEAAGNFQIDNTDKGGAGGDPVLAEAQNAGSDDDASFEPTPDGTPARLRVGLFTRSTMTPFDDLDGDYDGQLVLHEYGHGVSNRLVGGRTSTSCLGQIQSGALGEGWSDYFAISYFNNPVFGAYPAQNTVHGFRRQSYEGYTFTYEDVGNSGFEVHDDGEIWAAALWDLRKSLGQAVTDRLVVNGLKATPCNPSMTDARDAILSADMASNSGANRLAIWTVFAKHGLGYSSRGLDGSNRSGTLYDAAYDLPPDLQTLRNPAITSQPLSISAGAGDLYTYAILASNPNAGTLSFTLISGPSGMAVSPAGTVTWTASFTPQRVKITITDGKGGKVTHGYLAPVQTRLSSDRSVLISGAADSEGYATFDVPSGTPILQVTLRGGIGDADLIVTDPDGSFDFSLRVGNNETLSFPIPKAGRWNIAADGYDAYSGVFLMASLVTPTPLSTNTRIAGLGGIAGSESFYKLTIPPGTSSFQVSTSNAAAGTGDVDLFLKFGSPVACQLSILVTTPCNDDKRSAEAGNNEAIAVSNPSPGDWYLDLSAYKDYNFVILTTSLTAGAPQPDLAITKTHTGNFTAGQNGATYTIGVTNSGSASTTGLVTVADSLPSGLTATAIAGNGWTCVLGTLTCTRSDALAAAGSYPSIVVTVNVAANASSSVTNTATVAGGGDLNGSNNTARDVTSIVLPTGPVVTLVGNAFGESPLIAPNTWVEIKGSNLAPAGDTRIWLNPDFVNNQMPVQLDGVSVKVNGKSAYVYYISPTQVNILTPPDELSGSVQVQLTNNGVTSNVVNVDGRAQSLSFFEFVSATGAHYVYGRHSDGSLIGPASLFPGFSTPVKPGEDIYIAANGFGPTDVPVVSGAITQTGNLPPPFPVIKVAGISAHVSFAGLVGVGTYQINFTVPPDVPDGDLALTAIYDGLNIQSNLLITVQH